MNSSALIMMVIAWGVIISFTLYFLIKAMKNNKLSE